MTTIPEPKMTFVFAARVDVGPVMTIGETAKGLRRIIPITGGSFEGPELKGEVLPGGADWQLIHDDSLMELEARYTLRTDRGELVYVKNLAIRQGPRDVIRRLMAGEKVDDTLYYGRCAPVFETGSARLAWMNSRIFVGLVQRDPDATILQFFMLE